MRADLDDLKQDLPQANMEADIDNIDIGLYRAI